MITFLEFYEVLLRFILFKLFYNKQWNYPPVVNKDLEVEGCHLLAMKTESAAVADINNGNGISGKNGTATGGGVVGKKKDDKVVNAIDISSILNKKKGKGKGEYTDKEEEDGVEEDDDEDEEEDIRENLTSAFSDLQSFQSPNSSTAITSDEITQDEKEIFHLSSSASSSSSSNSNLLFSNLVFFLNREVPLDWCQLCITSFGGKLGWDSPVSPIQSNDSRITHHIIDRPIQGINNNTANREYIQPQWLFDCINAKLLLPTRLYSPGIKLPPHLSPFVNDEKEGYLPAYREEIKKLQTGSDNSNIIEGLGEEREKKDNEESDEEGVQGIDEEDDDYHQGSSSNKKGKAVTTAGKKQQKNQESSDEESEDESEEEDDEEPEEIEAIPIVSSSKKGPKAVVYQNKKNPELSEVSSLFMRNVLCMRRKQICVVPYLLLFCVFVCFCCSCIFFCVSLLRSQRESQTRIIEILFLRSRILL
jgi:pescadillo protein